MSNRNRVNREAQRLSLFYDLNNNPPSTVCEEYFPLHLTIVPAFTLGRASHHRDWWDLINNICEDFQPIPLERGDEAVYGSKNIPGTEMLDVSGKLTELHTTLVTGLGEVGCQFIDLRHSLDNYTPHITHKFTNPLVETPTEIDSVTLTTRLQREDEAVKIIVTSVELQESDIQTRQLRALA